jgi:hypothetical protein
MTGVWTGVGEFPEEADLVLGTPGVWFGLEEDTSDNAAPGSLSMLVGAMNDPTSPANTCVTTAEDSSSSTSGVISATANYTITVYQLDASSSSVTPTNIKVDSPNCQLNMTVDPQSLWTSTVVNPNNTGCPSYFDETAPFDPIPLTNSLPLVSPSSSPQGCVPKASRPVIPVSDLPEQPPLSEWPTFSNLGQPPLLRGYFVADVEEMAGVVVYSDTVFAKAQYFSNYGTFTGFGRYLSYDCLSPTQYKAMAAFTTLANATGFTFTEYFCEIGTWNEKSQMIETRYTTNLTSCLSDKEPDYYWNGSSSKLVASLKAGPAMEECSGWSSNGGVKKGSGLMMVVMMMVTLVVGF